MELLSKPEFMGSSNARQEASDFISKTTVIPLNDKVEYQTIRIRRNNPRIKLPDAGILGTHVPAFNITLIVASRRAITGHNPADTLVVHGSAFPNLQMFTPGTQYRERYIRAVTTIRARHAASPLRLARRRSLPAAAGRWLLPLPCR